MVRAFLVLWWFTNLVMESRVRIVDFGIVSAHQLMESSTKIQAYEFVGNPRCLGQVKMEIFELESLLEILCFY